MKITYKPTAKQRVFHLCRAKHKLYGGAAGGGKTQAILFELIMNCFKYPGIKQLFVRKTYGEIMEILDERLPKIIEGGDKLVKHNKGGNVIRIGKSSIVLGYFQDKKSNEKYFSMEYDVIAVDEITRTIYTHKDFELLVSRNRTAKKDLLALGFSPYFMAGTNPGGLGHQRVKTLWIDKVIPNGYDKKDFEFIPATLKDNPHLSETDPYYEKRLMALQDESLKKALLYGDRNLFEGQYFSEWLEPVHTVDKFNYVGGGARKSILCLDYGYTAPSAVYKVDKDNDDNYYISSELYETHLTYTQLGEKIRNKYDLSEIDYIIADPAIFSKTGTDYSGAEILLQTTGKKIIPADNERVPGRMLIKQLLKDNRMFVHKNCLQLIRQFPMVIYDDKKDGDLDTNGEDHGLDAIRYGLMDIASIKNTFKNTEGINKLMTKDPESNDSFLKMNF